MSKFHLFILKQQITVNYSTLGSKTLSNTTNNQNVSATTVNTPTTPTSVDPVLPHKGAAEEERHSSMAIFFVLSVIGSCILLIHFILETKFQYIPESLAVVFLGAAIGLVMKICSQNFGDWKVCYFCSLIYHKFKCINDQTERRNSKSDNVFPCIVATDHV